MKRVEFVIGKGASFNKVLFWKNRDGTPVDLTGLTVRVPMTFNTTVIDATVATDIPTGKITISLTPAQTTTIKWIEGKFEVFIDRSDGEILKLLVGTCKVI